MKEKNIKTITVNLKGRPYPVYIEKDILRNFGTYFEKHVKTRQIAIISHPGILDLYGAQLKASLPSDAEICEILVAEGEQSKSHETLWNLYTQLLENHFERTSAIIALGGGVIGDLAGYAAATYLRGVHLVHVPTSLLAQVDSSIGGKAGINHPLGKNLIGAFKQPNFVFSDISVLATLPEAEIRCGMGEVIKYAFILDNDLFIFLEKNLEKALQGDPEILQHLVTVSARHKAQVVASDEKEADLRMILNFGHTFGHALEAESGYGILKHGEAVILGMKCALYYSHEINMLPKTDYERGMALLNRVPLKFDKSIISTDNLVKRIALDKKVSEKNVRLILIDKIGFWKINENSDIKRMYNAFNILNEV